MRFNPLSQLAVALPVLGLALAAVSPIALPVFVEMQVDGPDLEGAAAIALSPDGRTLYATSSLDDAVLVFSREPASGAISLIEAHKNGVHGVEGLDGAGDIAISPDGAQLYVAGSEDNAVAAFSGDAASGRLTFLDVYWDNSGGLDGLAGAETLVMSANGAHLYVVGFLDDAIALFGRNPVTGALTFIECYKDDEAETQPGPVDLGLNGARSAALSPDGAQLYATGSSDHALAVFSRDQLTGRLTFVYKYDDFMSSNAYGLLGAHTVTLDPGGTHLYVTGSLDDAITVFSRNSSTGLLSWVQKIQDGVGGVDGLNGAGAITVSPDGSYVYVGGTDDSAVAYFSRNSSSGALTFQHAYKDDQAFPNPGPVDLGLSRVRDVVVSPEPGGPLYTTGASDGALTIFGREAASGALSLVEVRRDAAGGVDGLDRVLATALSPDGDQLYAVGAQDNAVAHFQRNAATGALTFSQVHRNGVNGVQGLEGAETITVSPDGRHVYITGGHFGLGHAVSLFARNETSGNLTFVEAYQNPIGGSGGLARVSGLAVSPDGRSVYVVSSFDNAVALFNRNQLTGRLTLVERYQDGLDHIDGLGGARAVAVSPEGAHVYVVSSSDAALAVFSRDGTSGQLTPVQVLWDDQNGVDGLGSGSSIALSPDGRQLYTSSGYPDNGVAVFARNGTSGRLAFVEVHKDDVAAEPGPIDLGLQNARSVRVSPDGRLVYAVGPQEDALAVFSRDMTTGALTFAGLRRDGADGIKGLDGIWSITLSPDGNYLYAAGRSDDALVVLAQPWPAIYYLPVMFKQ